MADRYLHLTGTAPGRFLTRRLGLPQPAALRRWSLETPRLDGPLLHLTAGDSEITDELAKALAATGLTVDPQAAHPAGIVLDATGVTSARGLAEVHAALHPVVRSQAPGGRIVVIGTPPSSEDHHQAAAQRRWRVSSGRWGRRPGAAPPPSSCGSRQAPRRAAESTLRFLLSPRSAYVSGQVIELTTAAPDPVADQDAPLTGRTALVTGAARGIGASVASVLARDGAHVIVLDVPQAQDDLVRTADRLGATALPLDITAPDAAARIAAAAPDGLDILVHNAGITRDRRLANMPAERWAQVIDVNLDSVLRTTDELLISGTLNRGGRVVATASIAGIAGNNGQTNYAASKAGVIGLVRSLGPRAAAEHGVTVNAVAPGFIETRMTAAVPLFIREAGRRMNSLAQGGLPVDVAEAVAWFAQPWLRRRQRPGAARLRPEPAGGVRPMTSLSASLVRGALSSPLKRAGRPDATLPPDHLTRPAAPVAPGPLAAYARICGFAESGPLPLTYPHRPGLPAHHAADDRARLPAAGPRARPHLDRDHPAPARAAHRAARTGGVRRWVDPAPARNRGHDGDRGAGGRGAGVGVPQRLSVPASGRRMRLPRPARLRSRTSPASCPPSPSGRCPAISGGATGRLRGPQPDPPPPADRPAVRLPRAIAHGMWTVARCLAEAGDPVGIRSVRAEFRAPVLLPATVTYAADAAGSAFALRGAKGRVHLVGAVTRAS